MITFANNWNGVNHPYQEPTPEAIEAYARAYEIAHPVLTPPEYDERMDRKPMTAVGEESGQLPPVSWEFAR